ncbi:MAG TPA: hypothetical protein VFO65_05710 [Acidimicrobiales bacterium]|nr:hypothetical protein [Acidimicrobiales bacterium]
MSGRGRGHLAGTGRLVRHILRRDRLRLAVWVLAIGLSVAGSASAFPRTLPTAADRAQRAEVIGNAGAQVFVGPGYGLDDYTYGAMTANEMGPMTLVAMALMSIFLMVRNTRAEEEAGRADLVRSTAVGRHAPLAAALAVVAGANLAVGLVLALGLPAALPELSRTGSAAFAASMVSAGLVFGAVALVAAQVATQARAAVGMASAVLAATYALRVVGDIAVAPLSWLSPVGWALSTRAYVDERWWPLALAAGATGALVAVAVRIAAHRDVGAGVLVAGGGPPTASAALRSPLGLAVRLQRTSVIAWGASLFLGGLLFGSIAEEAGEFYETNDLAQDYLERIGAARAGDQYLALVLFVTVLMAAAFALQSVLRLRGEESAERAEPVLAAAVSRWRWAASHLAVALAGSVVLLALMGLGAGITSAVVRGRAGEVPRMLGAGLAYAPALWVFAGLAMLVFGLAPRAVGLVWFALAAVVTSGWLGPILGLPEWAYDLSPVEHVPRLPVAAFDPVPLVALTAVAAVLIGVGLAALRRRDLT